MAIPFKRPNGSDGLLLGQILGIASWTVSIVVECKCGADGRGGVVTLMAQEDHMGRRTTGVICPKCGHTLTLSKMAFDQKGQMVFDIDRSDLREPVTVPAETATKTPAAS